MRPIVACCIALLAMDAWAQWSFDELMRRMAQTPEARAHFSEKKYSTLTTEPLQSSGTLAYLRPDRIVKRTAKPHEETISVAGDVLTVENPARKQSRELSLAGYPVVWAFVESIRGTLSGNAGILKRFYEVRLDGSPTAWTLTLKPRERQMADVVDAIRLFGSGERIQTIEILEASGDRSVMAITPEK